ncbi:hypothetical protein [Bacteroides sp. 519]|uniref:DUF7336 domain-containing protein n=1 Tax=Bacteroides sp. 519 TaxID=2302937 RepID=UPI0013D4EA31|nr:hypothetical protein [Bacteroides sp. 519]NDV58955.1 hypothetical protein [Bacteroides sp. 519]
MKDSNGFYIVDYVYETEDENYTDVECYAFIGIFSSKEKANNAIDHLMSQIGFKDHSRECFYISFLELDKTLEWKSGFTRE